MRPIHVWRSRTPAGVRCANFPSIITTIMDNKRQLLKPLNKPQLYSLVLWRRKEAKECRRCFCVYFNIRFIGLYVIWHVLEKTYNKVSSFAAIVIIASIFW
jgi:hypothetical protein